MFSKDLSSKRRQQKRAVVGMLLGGLIASTALGADTPPATGAAPAKPNTAPDCHRGGDVDLAKLNERAAKTFAAADTNGDGKITLEEFLVFRPSHGGPPGHPGMGGPGMGGPGMDGPGMGGPGMGMMGFGPPPGGTPPTAQERDAKMQAFQDNLFKALDTDHNGQLSQAEFSKAWETAQTMMKKEMFTKLDKNGDGVLTKDEFPPMVQKMSAMDTNGDGTVSHDEMKAAHAAKGAQNGQTPN